MLPLKIISVLPRFIIILRVFGTSFLYFKDLCTVLFNFVYGRESESNEETFKAEVETVRYLLPNSTNSFVKEFRALHEFGKQFNTPTGCLLITKYEHCRRCQRKLSTDPKTHTIIVYHLLLGSFLGSRATKYCKNCKIHEHYGFWTCEGQKHYTLDCVGMEYLLSTEDTAFDMCLLSEYSSLLVVGAVPFSTYAGAYNKRFKDENKRDVKENTSIKRMKWNSSRLLEERNKLDRRRLEEAFILYGVVKAMKRHNITIPYFPCDRNFLVKLLVEKYHEAFIKKWGDHVCSVNGCNNVMVLDGNMKNCRQVCSVKNAVELKFEGLEGSISIGCLNTPAKGQRVCGEHTELTCKFVDDMVEVSTSESTESDVIPLRILNKKETRNATFCEILWNDGRRSWVKENNVPKEIVSTVVNVEEFGQARRVLRKGTLVDESITELKSSGFGKETLEDNEVIVDGIKETLNCDTEKGKHKSKNCKSAGILVFEKPCGIVLDVKEIFGSESKSQVYGHLHYLLKRSNMQSVDVICYDDACHLKKFAENKCRRNLTETSQRISGMSIVCDRFHFKNHVGKWCRRHCNPNTVERLQGVNTEICEQLFSWLSKFSPITKHMNRHRFMFLMLFVLDEHNMDTI